MSSSLSQTAILTTAAGIASLYFLQRGHRQQPHNPYPMLHTALNVFVVVHSVYWLRALLFYPTSNIFTAFKIPLNAPSDLIRELLQQRIGDLILPRHLEVLLKRLSSFDARTLYLRFGHDALTHCEYCHGFDDFAMYALSPVLVSYILEAAVIGLVTMRNSHREPLRTLGLGILVCAGVSEAYNLLTTPIQIPQRGHGEGVFMWYDNLTFLRHTLFLLLPVLISSPLVLYLPPALSPFPRIPHPTKPGHTIPNPVAPNPAQSLQRTFDNLQSTMTRLHLIKYTHAAVMRTPELRRTAERWWDREKKEGDAIRRDAEVRRVARGVGLGFDEIGDRVENEEGSSPQSQQQHNVGPLRASAKIAVSNLQAGFVPSSYWGPPPQAS
ncbi:hypothetical protein AX16_011007 [Volvariella volvacea WC 439]|nr:hypothetical protein AX16_011007 [Volvariella volvacea WC 439]